jgi:hypothetical protein
MHVLCPYAFTAHSSCPNPPVPLPVLTSWEFLFPSRRMRWLLPPG